MGIVNGRFSGGSEVIELLPPAAGIDILSTAIQIHTEAG